MSLLFIPLSLGFLKTLDRSCRRASVDVERTYIMVLGPMTPTEDDRVVLPPPTQLLISLLKSIADRIRSADLTKEFGDIEVEGPDEGATSLIVTDVFEKIERAHLVVIDLTGNSVNVGYEIGLVHSLGLPHVVVTSDNQPGFYFRMSQFIGAFKLKLEFDPEVESHRKLYNKVLDFLRASNKANKEAIYKTFTRSQQSEFFSLPVVDISAASGLATGYWRNSVRRFVRPGGYFTEKRRITWDQDAAGAPEPYYTTVDRFIAVHPPSELAAESGLDLAEVHTTLQTLGFGLVRGTIHGFPGDTEDLRSFGATFVCRAGEATPLLPLIVIDLPTTLYALRDAPRIVRINREINAGRPEQDVLFQRQRRLADMIDRFKAVLTLLVNSSGFDPRKRFEMIRLHEFGARLPREGAG